MGFVTDDPRLTDRLPPLAREKSKIVTVRLKVVVLVVPPPVPVTVTGNVPLGVVAEVTMVRVVVHVGLQLVGENDAVAPEGSPEAVKLTG